MRFEVAAHIARFGKGGVAAREGADKRLGAGMATEVAV
jgi:hypothetical protein